MVAGNPIGIDAPTRCIQGIFQYPCRQLNLEGSSLLQSLRFTDFLLCNQSVAGWVETKYVSGSENVKDSSRLRILAVSGCPNEVRAFSVMFGDGTSDRRKCANLQFCKVLLSQNEGGFAFRWWTVYW